MNLKGLAVAFCVGLVIPVAAQQAATNATGQKPRVFVSDSQSWSVGGGGGGTSGGFGEAGSGGARPQTAEIIKTFGERCPQVIINNRQDKADYVVLLDHEGGKGPLSHDNKVVVFNTEGDSILSHSTLSLGNSVKDACDAIVKDWPAAAARLRAGAAGDPPAGEKAAEAASAGKIAVNSTPSGADIEMDGSFVGSTPSVIDVSPGYHSIAVKKAGYQTWQRKMRIMSGSIQVSAELEKAQ